MNKKRADRTKATRAATRAALPTKVAKRASKPPKKAGPPDVAVATALLRAVPARPAATPRLTVRMIAEPEPYAEVSIHESVVEASMEGLFEHARGALLRYQPRRVLVDMHDVEMKLSISDLNGLAKLIAGSFVGLVERLALVLRARDLPSEKFFEPSMIHRGLPTYVSVDKNDAIDWLTSRQRPRR